MTTSSPVPTGAKPANSRSRVITASLVGTTIEFYDFYAYATAAVLVFPILFFPSENETAAEIVTPNETEFAWLIEHLDGDVGASRRALEAARLADDELAALCAFAWGR